MTLRRAPQPAAVAGDREALGELFINIVLNAVEAVRQNPAAAAKVAVEMTAGQGSAVVRVLDSGLGPKAEVRERLFEPFVTEKPEGTGLGLFVARRIAEAHRGRIGWERLESMTCFTVELPLE